MRSKDFHHHAVVVLLSLTLGACGTGGGGGDGSSSDDLHTLAWSPTVTNPIDTGSGVAVVSGPLVVKEPDPADNDGAGTNDDAFTSGMAVWIEKTDLNPFDSLPALYHLYARSFSAGAWAGTDAGCPADGQPENSDGDGICVIDTGSSDFGAWLPQVSMDDNGDAIVVWQQADGTDCDAITPGTQSCANIYARRFAGPAGLKSWGGVDTIDVANTQAVNSSLAMGGGTAMVVWEQWDGAGPNSPATAAGTNWTTPTNVFSSNDAYAIYNNTAQNDLCITGFGFSIPAGLAINGIQVTLEGNGTSGTAAQRQYRIGLTKAGCALAGTRKTGIQMNQTSDTETVTGGPGDLWSTTWTVAEVNASTFGVLISDNDATAAALNIDWIRITINGTWSIYARRFTGGIALGSWAIADATTGCTALTGENGANDGVCGIDAQFTSPAHQPRVRMTNAGNAIAVFIQFADAICYTVPVGRTTPVTSFPCPHNRLYYRTYPAGGSWTAATDFTPATSLPSALGCFDFLSSTGGEAMDCDCGGWGCDCNTINTPIDTVTCRSFSSTRLDMDRTATSSAAVVYKSVENALVPDISGDCDCDCGGWGCDCDCETFDPSGGTDTYQEIHIEGWRNTGGAGTYANPPLARFYYRPDLGPTSNCSSLNPSSGDDFSFILNCDLNAPTVAVEPNPADNDAGGPDDALTSILALYERSDGPSNPDQIYYNQFNGAAWSASALLVGSAANPAMAPQIAMDNVGNGLALFVQRYGGGKWRIYSRRNIAGTWVATDAAAGCVAGGLNGADDGVCNVDGDVDGRDGYFNPVVSMDGPGGPGSALALFIGLLTTDGSTRLYGVTGP